MYLSLIKSFFVTLPRDSLIHSLYFINVVSRTIFGIVLGCPCLVTVKQVNRVYSFAQLLTTGLALPVNLRPGM